VVVADGGFYWVQLDEEARERRDQPSFHIFAEGQHSDVRGQIFNLKAGDRLPRSDYTWPFLVSVFIGLIGVVEIRVDDHDFELGPLSQLVVLPGHHWQLTARTDASLELVSLASLQPRG
jgi:hypothetical protein